MILTGLKDLGACFVIIWFLAAAMAGGSVLRQRVRMARARIAGWLVVRGRERLAWHIAPCWPGPAADLVTRVPADHSVPSEPLTEDERDAFCDIAARYSELPEETP